MSDGFTKIPVEPQIKEKTMPIVDKKKRKNSRKLFGVVGVILFILIIFVSITALIGKDVYVSLQKTASTAREVKAAAKTQNIEDLKVKLVKLNGDLKETQGKYNKLSYLKFIPIVRNYYNDGYHGFLAATEGVDAGIIATDSLIPYADLLGLKGKGSFTGGSADERIQTAVKTFAKVIPQLNEISKKIENVKTHFDQIDPNRYPEKIGNTVVRARLVSARNIFDESANLFVNAQPLLERIPSILGEPDSKRYLVLFQNASEQRATGGFLTGYAIFRVDHGKIIAEKSDDIYKLDALKTKKTPAPAEILKYHKGVYTFELRDSNISPDFPTSVKKFEELLSSVPDFSSYDGVVSIDTHVLVSSIKILGEFNISGRKLSADIDKRCNCPRVLYELEDYSTRPVAYIREERKDILGVLLYQIMQRAFGVSPGQYWGKLFQMALTEMEEKHMMFLFKDAKAQEGFDALNFSGRIREFNNPYLHVNDVNFAGAKSNLFATEAVKYDLTVDSNGTGTVTLTLNYKNPAPPSDCNLESGGLCLNGLLRDWVRVYAPKGSQLLEFKGSEMDTVSYDDLGKTVFEGFITLKPQGTAQAMLRYKMPFKFEKGKQYPFLIQKQPGTEGNEYTIIVNGRQIDKFNLRKDTQLILKP